MKKNKILFVLVASLLSFGSLAGCNLSSPAEPKDSQSNVSSSQQNGPSSQGDNASSSNGGNSQSSEQNGNSSSQGGSQSSSQGGGTSSNNGGQSSSNNGGNSSSQGGSQQFSFPDGDAELKKLVAKNGYELTATVQEGTSSGAFSIGEKGQDDWFTSSDDKEQIGYGFRAGKYNDTDITHIFVKENTWSYALALIDASDMYDNMFGTVYNIVTLGQKELKDAIATAQGSKATVGNREAYKYTITVEGASGEVYIDTQYGIVLKTVSSEYTFEITSINLNPSVPYNNISIPEDYDVYADYAATYSGKPLNGPSLSLSDKFYIKFQQYAIEDGRKEQVTTLNLMKDGNNTLGYYQSGGSTFVDEWDAKTDGSGYLERQAQVYSGTGRADWGKGPTEKTNDEFLANLEQYLGARTYLQYAKKANAVPDKDKAIAGVNCKAYEVSTGYGSYYTVEMKFWVDPVTNIVFYGYNKVTSGEYVIETVNIDVLEFSNYLTNGFFDYACESLIYREQTTPQASDTHHVQSEPGVVKEATCSEKGEMGTKCIYCGYKTVTSEIEKDPNNHSGKSDYWYDDGEGHHYHECYECYEKYDIGDHQLDESELKPTCSGKAELKCAICEREVEFDVEKSETHTYNIWHYDLSNYYNYDPDLQVTVNWHCDCWYQDSWDREGEAGEDLVWNVPKLSNTDYFTYREVSNYGYSYGEYKANKDALKRDIKAIWTNELDETIDEVLDEILSNMGFYNGTLTTY